MNPRSCEDLRVALAVAVGSLSRSALCRSWELELGRVELCALGDYPECGVSSDADCVAAVIVGMQGAHCGCALLALEPVDALRWVDAPCRGEAWQPGDAQAALERYVSSAGKVARAISACVMPGSRCGPPRLVEESLPGALISTHAPRDTMLLSCELFFRRDGTVLASHVGVLLDAKLLARDGKPAGS